MKHLKLFNNINELNYYKNSNNYILPNVSYEINTHSMSYEELLYIPLEYIESSGSNYIALETLDNYAEYNTNATIKFKVNIIEPGIDNHKQAIVMCPESAGKFFIDRDYLTNGEKLRVGLGSTSTNDREFFQNNENVIYSFNTIINDLNHSLYLFSGGELIKRFSHAQIYYLQLYKDNILTLDLIPVHNIKTNEDGVLDRVRNKFYGFIEYTK